MEAVSKPQPFSEKLSLDQAVSKPQPFSEKLSLDLTGRISQAKSCNHLYFLH